ncbi:MAG: NUDIX hydrolase [Isosphaeraceae bacterium]
MPERFCYDFPRPQVTVDLVVFTYLDGKLKTLLIRRGRAPFAGKWAIPGGFLEMEEPEEAAARRELKEETGIEVSGAIEPIGFFGRPGRDPRGRTITLAHATVLRAGEHAIQGGDDAVEAAWVNLDADLELAFDHVEILHVARDWLRRGVADDLGLRILPESFSLDDVLGLFHELAIHRHRGFAWLARNLRRGRIRTGPEASGQFHLAEPAT